MPARQWLTERLVNTTTTASQFNPDSAVLADGRYIIVWEDTNLTNSRIMAQVFNTDGTPDGGEFAINTVIAFAQTTPAVTALPDGGYFVTYIYNETFSRYQEFSADNTPQYNSFAGNSLINVDSTNVGTGVWAMEANAGVNNEISVYRYSENSGSLSFDGSFTAQSGTAGIQTDPDAAQLNNGNVVVVWEDDTANRVEMRIFDDTGAAITADITVTNSNTSFPNPEVMALANGGFIVSYVTYNGSFPGNSYDARAQIFAPDGTAYGNEIFINTQTTGTQRYQVLTPTTNGGFAAFWLDFDGGADTVEGQLFDGFGNRIGGQFTAAGFNVNGNYDSLDAATLPDGRIVVTWDDTAIDGNLSGVAQVIIDPRDGVVQGTENDDVALLGSFFDDQINGFQGDDYLFGREGDDFLSGGLGDDWLTGGEGADLLVGGAGGQDLAVYEFSSAALTINLATFSISGGDADGDRISGIDGAFGSSFNDVMSGNGAANTFYGYAGSDTINTGGGDDIVYGGTGLDIINGGNGEDYIEGGAQNDTINGGNNDDVLRGGDGNDIIHGGAQGDELYGGNNNDTLYGDGGNDYLEGGGQADTLYGGFNNDDLYGGNGDDTLFGGGQSDYLYGGANKDTLDGGLGNDYLHGGSQADIFIYAAGYDEDTIADFQNNIDVVDLSAFGFASTAQAVSIAVEVSGDVIFNFGAGTGDVLTVEGTTIADLQDDILIA